MKNILDKLRKGEVTHGGDIESAEALEIARLALEGKVAEPNEELHANLNDKGCFEQNDDRGPFISTYSGALFFVNEMNVKDVPILDIAQALSMNCRFNGHIDRFYSVAEHSVLVSNLVSEESALYGLLHDYAEAFVSDVPRPFKSSITGHEKFEAAVMANVCALYGLPLDLPEDVAYIDTHICAAEATVLAKVVPDWVQYYDTNIVSPQEIRGLEPKQARAAFMNRFNELTA